MKLQKIEYSDLSSRDKEMYNFQKASAILADYGFVCKWINSNQNRGDVDFIAVHFDGAPDIKIQLTGGIYFAKKYRNKNLYICFREDGEIYLYPHDEILSKTDISDKKWKREGTYFKTKLTKKHRNLLEPHKL